MDKLSTSQLFTEAAATSRELLQKRLTMPDVWDRAERFRPYCRDQQGPIERPERVDDFCRPLTVSLYPDCPLCGRSIAVCPCDPDESSEALWLQFKLQQGGSNA